MSSFDVDIDIAAENVLHLLMADKVKDAISLSEQHLNSDIQHPCFLFCKAISFLGSNNVPKFRNIFEDIKLIPTAIYIDFYNFGLFFQRNQAFHLAIECFGESAKRQPDFANNYLQLGGAFLAIDEIEGATSAFKTAIEIIPNDHDSLYKLGICLERQHLPEQALEVYDTAHTLHPSSKQVNFGRARCNFNLGELQKSYTIFMDNLNPLDTSPEEQLFLGLLFSEYDQLKWYQLLKIQRNSGFTNRQLLAQTIERMGVKSAAIPLVLLSLFKYKNKLFLPKPVVNIIISPFILTTIIFQYILWPFKLLTSSEDKIKGPHPLFNGRLFTFLSQPFIGLERAMSHLDSAAQTFYRLGWTHRAETIAKRNLQILPTHDRADILTRILLASSNCNSEQFYTQSKLNADKLKLAEILPRIAPDLSPERILNVGLLSDIFHGPIALTTIIPQLSNHDPEKVRFFIYHSGPWAAPETYSNHVYRHVPHLEDDTLNRVIREDTIDILIEMNGPLRPNNRLGVIRRRAAPIQVSWYNLCATTGIEEVDYIITDEISVPQNQQKYYTEKLLYLSGKAVGGWKLEADPPISSPPFQKNNFVMFACFGDSFKINQDVITTWAEVLNGVPKSKLFIKNELAGKALTRLFLIQSFAYEGISPDRLIFEGFTPYKHMCRRYKDVDLVLDTFPYTNGSTTMNALWQGVPTLTISGPDWRSRMSTSIMASAKFDRFICEDKTTFIKRAIEIGNSPNELIELRKNIRPHLLEHSRYFQIKEYARDFEDGMRSIWHDYITEQTLSAHEMRAKSAP
ncbi:MAG: hypothetical protein V7776_17530 [Halopseudomonas aestusnigri]